MLTKSEQISLSLYHGLQELMHINVVKGIKDTFGAKTFMGRSLIPIRPFADRPGEPVTDWYDMGKGEWSNDDGTVRLPVSPQGHPYCSAVHRESGCSDHARCMLDSTRIQSMSWTGLTGAGANGPTMMAC